MCSGNEIKCRDKNELDVDGIWRKFQSAGAAAWKAVESIMVWVRVGGSENGAGKWGMTNINLDRYEGTALLRVL